jgi:hypothetical protein
MKRMNRALLASACVLTIFSLTAACGSPLGTVPATPVLTEAQATDVRRTAVAEVQRIIANNPTATPLPASTPTPSPTCQGAIWWNEARAHVGEQRTVQGRVLAVRPVGDKMTLLEIGQPYPDPTGFVILAPATGPGVFDGKTVCAAGRLVRMEGVPALQVRDVSAVSIVDDQR